mgnify:CR=1 FL=1
MLLFFAVSAIPRSSVFVEPFSHEFGPTARARRDAKRVSRRAALLHTATSKQDTLAAHAPHRTLCFDYGLFWRAQGRATRCS